MTPVNTLQGTGAAWRVAATKILGNLAAIARALAVRPRQVVYVSANAGKGMWFSTLVCLAGRIRRARLMIHHHSYDYISLPNVRIHALARAAGPEAVHIVLGATMAAGLKRRVPEAGKVFVLGNAGLMDARLSEIPQGRHQIALGHLSNLSADKGIQEAIDLAASAREAGLGARLVLAGPATDSAAKDSIKRAANRLGNAFEYRGPLDPDQKIKFFSDINHFVFPTRYRNEASPLVILEALAAGVRCIATKRGMKAEQRSGGGGRCVSPEADFSIEGVEWLNAMDGSYYEHAESARRRFVGLADEYRSQIAILTDLVLRA